jgi:hypothetical protein
MPALAVLAGCASAPGPDHRRPGAEGAPERHGSFFISPMGEPFRNAAGAPAFAWFSNADADKDGAISLAEMEGDAARFFATLDLDRDGEIDPAEVTRYEEEIAPELHQLGRFGAGAGGGASGRFGGGRGAGRGGGGGGRGRGHGGGGGPRGGNPEGGGRPGGGRAAGLGGAGGLLNLPEPVTAADADMNRGVSAAEYGRAAGQRFLLIDLDRDGRITPEEIHPRRPRRR